MKKIIAFLTIIMLCQDIGLAYQIVATDTKCYVLSEGRVKEDPNRYKVVYEVNEADATISVVEETDLRTGERWKGDSVYQIVPKATVLEAKENLKGYKINPRRASVEAISFCEGEYVYSKTQEAHINLFYGTYAIVKNDK